MEPTSAPVDNIFALISSLSSSLISALLVYMTIRTDRKKTAAARDSASHAAVLRIETLEHQLSNQSADTPPIQQQLALVQQQQHSQADILRALQKSSAEQTKISAQVQSDCAYFRGAFEQFMKMYNKFQRG